MIRMSFTAAAASLVLLTAAPGHGQDLKVTLLGTGRPDPAIDRFGPATLVEAGKQTLLFDCGRGASQRLWQLKTPLSRIDALFLTHLHSDHTVGIPDLWLTGWLPTPFGHRTGPLHVRGPEGTRAMMSSLREAYQWDIRVRRDGEGLPASGIEVDAQDIQQGVVYERDGVKVTAFKVDHGGILQPAFGYRIDYGGKSVVISGDTRPNENLVRFASKADVIIHEVIAARPELLAKSPDARRIVGFHTSPEDAGRIFERLKPKLAVYYHVVLLTTDPSISPPNVLELVPRTRTTYSGPLEVGEDLMTIVIGDSVEVRRFPQLKP
jgi:ribonuclease Z